MRFRVFGVGAALLAANLAWAKPALSGEQGKPERSGPVHLRCEYLENPMGVEKAAPQLSWQMKNTERNWEQAAYEVLVASNEEALKGGKGDVWDSGKTAGSESVGIHYAGEQLQSRRRYFWKVRVWDTRGRVTESLEPAWWEMGLLNASDWKAKWISWRDGRDEGDRGAMRWMWVEGQNALSVAPHTAATFRSKISLNEKPFDAAILVAARGSYIAMVNGHEVGRKSEWTSFDRRDITDALVIGENTIELKGSSLTPDSDDPQKDTKTYPTAVTAIVKITSADGEVKRYAAAESWEAKLDSGGDWRPAQMVGELSDTRLGDPGPMPKAASYLRKSVELGDGVKSARLFVTALGSYRFFVNGQRVSGDVLTPDYTDYRKRVLYQTYDVTSFLMKGKNALAAVLGDGWYGSGLTWSGTHFFSAPDRLMAQLEIEYRDGRHETVVSDESWKGKASPILRSGIYEGEEYDARVEQAGWEKATFDDARWSAVSIEESPAIAISSQVTAPARVVMTLAPKKILRGPGGAYIFDMGQNMVGWAALKVKGAAGTRVWLRFAEILTPDGSIYTENLRNADATDLYVLKGSGEEEFAPHFTFHGFRYVEVSGYPGAPELSALTGEVVSSVSGEPTGRLNTSSTLVNQMWTIGIWGQRGNFLSVPTDCPQRDERLGWMGDAGVFWRTGTYNFDVAAFSQKFVQDIADAQTPQGAFTNISPNTLPVDAPEGTRQWLEQMEGAPGWGDAGVIVPWTTWKQYGDRDVILRNWDAMQRWTTFIENRNPDFLRKEGLGPNYGDWLAPDEHTDKSMLATAYWGLIAEMMAEMGRAVGKSEDASRYDELIGKIRGAFQKAYIRDDGTVGTGTQTSYVVALYAKMAPKELEGQLVEHLVKDIEARDWHLSTGFLGTPFLLFTLADHGRSDVAYRLLLNETYPSWGYMLSKGATTWWERWNGDTGDPGMNSYNHYAFGSVVAWVYRYVAGIDTESGAAGFKKIVIRPHLDGRMKFARGEYDSVYGKIVSDWKYAADGSFRLKVEIPANTAADVYLPARAHAVVFEAGKSVKTDGRDGEFMVHVGSGAYDFEVK